MLVHVAGEGFVFGGAVSSRLLGAREVDLGALSQEEVRFYGN
jgi:hypothetical protein